MTFTDYINYFKTAAVNHKQLLHNGNDRITYYSIDIMDLFNNSLNNLKYLSMLVECPEYKSVPNTDDNPKKNINGVFYIIDKVKIGDAAQRELVLNNTLNISEEVVSKMINDHKKALHNKNYNPAMKRLDPYSFEWVKFGPEVNNHYGWRVEFTLNDRFNNNLQLDETKWNNETKFSI